MGIFHKALTLTLTLIFVTEISAGKAEDLEKLFSKQLRFVAVEDHPWVIKNETCLKITENNTPQNACFTGFLIDLVKKFQEDLKFNYKIEMNQTIGNLDNSTTPAQWTGTIGLIASNKTDMALVALNITDELKKVVEFSTPFINKKESHKTFALAFPKGSKLIHPFDHMMKKLINQRHVEQLQEMWFNENTDLWQKEKQITIYP